MQEPNADQESMADQFSADFDDMCRLRDGIFITEDGKSPSQSEDDEKSVRDTAPLQQEPEICTELVTNRDAVLQRVYANASKAVKSLALTAAKQAIRSAMVVVENRIVVTCSVEVKKLSANLVSRQMGIAIENLVSRPSVFHHAPLYTHDVLERALATSEDRRKNMTKRMVADIVQHAHVRIAELGECIVADITRRAHDRFKVAFEAASTAVSGITSDALNQLMGTPVVHLCACGRIILSEHESCSTCQKEEPPLSGEYARSDVPAVDLSLSECQRNITGELAEEVVEESLANMVSVPECEPLPESVPVPAACEYLPLTAPEDVDTFQEVDQEMARECLGRAYKNGLVCAQNRADRQIAADVELPGEAQEIVSVGSSEGNSTPKKMAPTTEVQPSEVTDTVAPTPQSRPYTTEHHSPQQMSHSSYGPRVVSSAPAPSLPEAPRSNENGTKTSRMPRADSLKMLAALYGPVADQKLAQRPGTTPGTAGSMLSARSTSVGQPTGGGGSSIASAIPTPPSTAKPAKTPAHRLALRAQSRQSTQTVEEEQGTHLVNEKHDPEKLRDLDQRRLRNRFLKNLHSSKSQQTQTRRSEAVIQEYHWRFREMEIESRCRRAERKWHEREVKRREDVEMKRRELAEKSDESLNLRYGRFYAAPHSQQRPNRPENAELEQTGHVGESELDILWEAEALGVFQAAYNEAVGRFIDVPEEKHEEDDVEIDGASRSQEANTSGRAQSSNMASGLMLKSLPKGRVEWESPRNPWCPRRNVPQPSVEAVIASLLGGEQSAESSSSGRPSPTPSIGCHKPMRQPMTAWKRLPPVVPRRAVQDR